MKSTNDNYDETLHIFEEVAGSSQTSTMKEMIDTISQERIYSELEFDRRKIEVYEDVLGMIGIWQAALNCFRKQPGGCRPVELAYSIRQKGLPDGNPQKKPFLDNTPADILALSGLLPLREQLNAADQVENVEDVFSSLEAACIPLSDLNAYTLCKLSGIKIKWTTNLCRHFRLIKTGGRYEIELFALPSFFESNVPALIGFDSKLVQEFKDSYANLFYSFKRCHEGIFSRSIGQAFWCWCRHCVSKRIRKRALEELAEIMASDDS